MNFYKCNLATEVKKKGFEGYMWALSSIGSHKLYFLLAIRNMSLSLSMCLHADRPIANFESQKSVV